MPEQVCRPIDLVTAIGRLLSDHLLREGFERSPVSIADQIQIAEQDRRAFVSLDIEELNRQAIILIRKRWHEIRRLAPLTIDLLGDEGFELFRFYATNYWPRGYGRNVVDAYRFLRFLRQNRVQKPNAHELKRLRRMSRNL